MVLDYTIFCISIGHNTLVSEFVLPGVCVSVQG
jgi:hypothetical protein